MSTKRAVGGGPPARPPSQGRLKAIIQRSDAAPGSQGPSTLPPPPFGSEAEVRGLEWWLAAHMNLASALLGLEQHYGDGTEPPSSRKTDGHFEAMRVMVTHAGAVRDSLYELYCDAPDARLETLVSAGGTLERYVRSSYLWCEGVAALLAGLSAELRAGATPSWTQAKAAYREASIVYPGTGDAVLAAVKSLGIDFTSPVEPLRGLLNDLEQLLGGMTRMHDGLAKRFG
ncbi:MAG: hypothetical protein ACRENE_11260 [Polyangiaceae bacterium]